MSCKFFYASETKKSSFKDKLKSTISGISGSFILPISTLAVVSIFLVLGSFLQSISSNAFCKTFGGILKALAHPIIKCIPLLFCVAFAFSFCKGESIYVWTSLIAYLVFLSVQNAGIWVKNGTDGKFEGYVVLFSSGGRPPKSMKSLVDTTLGFYSLNTSMFGALVIGGCFMPLIQKRFSSIKFRDPISFFSGKRFVPFVASAFSGLFALFCLIFYPWIGTLIGLIGQGIAKTPYGIDSLIFGFLEKAMIPFGFHHMFYSPFWYSSLGGEVVRNLDEIIKCENSSGICLKPINGGGSSSSNGCTITQDMINNPQTATEAFAALLGASGGSYGMWSGDALIGVSALSLPSNTVKFDSSEIPVFDFIQQKLGINVGRFTQGKYPIMQFGLPAAAVAMIFAAPKGKRKQAIKTILPAIASSAVMGITEPIEFMFLYQAPKVFYGFHAVMCGISFMAMNLLGAHIPSIFSGGLIELILLGVINVGKGTYFWKYLQVGLLLAPTYFLAFSFFIRYFDLPTPGRKESESTSSVEDQPVNSKVPKATRDLALALGGWDNIKKYGNCASRLRYDIVDKSKVNTDKLKEAGVLAFSWVGDEHLQAIVGPKAESINQDMIKWKGEAL